MHKKFKIIILLNLLVLLLLTKNSSAINNITLTCDNINPLPGEEITISLVMNSSVLTNVSAYRLKVNFDNSKLIYKGLYSDISYDDFKSFSFDNTVNLLYVTTEKGFNINPNSEIIALELNFKVMSDAVFGETTISAAIDGLANFDAEELSIPEISPIVINISQQDNGDCNLALLEAEGFTLIPNFLPDITQYYLEVPYSQSSIEFNAVPIDESATVKISRKTLKKAGSSTDINITVISYNKKARKIYTITVKRLDKTISVQNNDKDDINNNTTSINNKSTVSSSKNSSKNSINNNSTKNIAKNKEISNDSNYTEYSSTNESNNKNNKIIKKLAAPLCLKSNVFSPEIYGVVSLIVIVIIIIIMKQQKENNKARHKNIQD